MPELLIRIKKSKDGSASLACVRADDRPLDVDRMTGELRSSADVNEQVQFTLSRDKTASAAPRQLTEAELLRVRELRGEVLAKWSALEPGETLELPFERD